MRQADQIILYIRKHGSITPRQAIRELGCLRLAARIGELKDRGYDIRREMIKVRTRSGSTMVARYSLGRG